MLLAALLVVVLSADVWWTCRCIRGDFEARGLTVRRIRWQPLVRLMSLRWNRNHMIYRVWYEDARGEAFSCRAVATFAGGFTTEDERREGDRRGIEPARVHASLARASASFAWPAAACSAGCMVAIGLPYWIQPYREVSLPGDLLTPALLAIVVAAAALQVATRRWLATLVALALAPVGVVALRIALDVARDASSHNLFPIELVIALVIGVPLAAIGVGLGSVARRVMPASPAPPARARAPRVHRS